MKLTSTEHFTHAVSDFKLNSRTVLKLQLNFENKFVFLTMVLDQRPILRGGAWTSRCQQVERCDMWRAL